MSLGQSFLLSIKFLLVKHNENCNPFNYHHHKQPDILSMWIEINGVNYIHWISNLSI